MLGAVPSETFAVGLLVACLAAAIVGRPPSPFEVVAVFFIVWGAPSLNAAFMVAVISTIFGFVVGILRPKGAKLTGGSNE